MSEFPSTHTLANSFANLIPCSYGYLSTYACAYIRCHDECQVVLVLQKIFPQLALQETWGLHVLLN